MVLRQQPMVSEIELCKIATNLCPQQHPNQSFCHNKFGFFVHDSVWWVASPLHSPSALQNSSLEAHVFLFFIRKDGLQQINWLILHGWMGKPLSGQHLFPGTLKVFKEISCMKNWSNLYLFNLFFFWSWNDIRPLRMLRTSANVAPKIEERSLCWCVDLDIVFNWGNVINGGN